MADILFIALAFFAITGAIAMLVYKSPMFSALGLLITMLSVAGMFALLNATLLFMFTPKELLLIFHQLSI